MTPDQLTSVVERDEFLGDDLQFFPEVYTDRRLLIEHIKAEAAQLKELAGLLEAPPTLSELIAFVRERIQLQQALAPETHHASVEDEYHSPFQSDTVEAPSGWTCRRGFQHRVGEFCNCGGGAT